jgi:8-oxo-dGTP diphosphatase
MDTILQFGDPLSNAKDRPGAYAVVKNELGQILTVIVKNRYHLPGGGIDAHEDPQQAVEREVLEETGLQIEGMAPIGQANQFLDTKDLGPINKLGIYFVGRVSNAPPLARSDADHEPKWITPEEFLSSTAHDFHKWAVQKSLEH